MEQSVFEKTQKICRLCLSAQPKLIEILNNRDIESLKVNLLIQEMCHIQLTATDPLPKMICKRCKKKLTEFHKFMNMCKESERKLNKIYEIELKRVQYSTNTCDISIQTEDVNEVASTEYQKVPPLVSTIPAIPIVKNIECIKNHSKNEIAFKSEQNIESTLQPVPNFVCDTCSMSFSTKESLTVHIKLHMPDFETKKSKPNAPDEEMVSDVTNIKVTTTSVESPSAQGNSVSTVEESPEDNGLKNSKPISQTKMQRIKETLTSEGQFLCDICGKALQTESGMRLHLKMHTGLKPYKCKVCEKGFAIESYKKRHELTHTGNKLFMCHFCSASFASANGFKYHLMAHTGDARHSCNICDKTFVRYKYLEEHRFTHTGQKPYACELCGAAYANSGSLFVHKKKCKGIISKRCGSKSTELNIVSNVYTKVEVIQGKVILNNKC